MVRLLPQRALWGAWGGAHLRGERRRILVVVEGALLLLLVVLEAAVLVLRFLTGH